MVHLVRWFTLKGRDVTRTVFALAFLCFFQFVVRPTAWVSMGEGPSGALVAASITIGKARPIYPWEGNAQAYAVLPIIA